MALDPVKLKIEYVNLKFIIISLDTSIPRLSKNEIDMFLGYKKFNNYYLIDISRGSGNLYAIIPYSEFTIYDFITLEITTPNYNSNKAKVYIVKRFLDGTASIDFKLSENEQGIYNIKLFSVNGKEFSAKTIPITVSLPLKKELCDAQLEGSGTYHIDDDVYVDVELYTILDEHVPNGTYEIELAIEDRY